MAAKPAAVEQPAFDSAKLYLWVKALEGKVNNLLREVDILKIDLIKKQNLLRKDTKVMNDDLLEFRHQQEQMVQKMDLIIKELKQTAGMEEVMTMKKYLELWNPLNFVSQRDLDRALEAKLAVLKEVSSSQSSPASSPVTTSPATSSPVTSSPASALPAGRSLPKTTVSAVKSTKNK